MFARTAHDKRIADRVADSEEKDRTARQKLTELEGYLAMYLAEARAGTSPGEGAWHRKQRNGVSKETRRQKKRAGEAR